MNKTKIKNFSIWARRNLIEVVAYRMRFLGIDENGIKPQMEGSTDKLKLYDMGTSKPAEVAGEDIEKRVNLANRIKDHERTSDYKTAYETMVEEIAYTWFNRLIAIRFMEVNDYLPSGVRVLSSESGKREPDIVTKAVEVAEDQGFSITKEEIWKLKEENKLDELFRIMFIQQCKKLHDILPELFDNSIDDYTELLLPISFIDDDAFIRHLVTDIDEVDFNISEQGQVEIIGWLYQYYNTEQNELVYDGNMSKDKVPKELIPAATTIYTPDWAVKYMVENSLGRFWANGHSDTSAKADWKYYLDETMQAEESGADISPEKIKFIDPCMGSGHILVYAFDVLMQIYLSCGYTERDAAQSIVRHNLWGLDLSKRAYQLAYFAVMMKARQYDRRFLGRGIEPNLAHFQDLPTPNYDLLDEPIKSFIEQFENADTYGSLIQVQADDSIDEALDKFEGNLMINRSQMEHYMSLYKIVSQRYEVVCTNPPYLGSGRFSSLLTDFTKKHFEDEKADLSMVMFRHAVDNLVAKDGYVSFITTSSWFFLSSFEKLRKYIVNSYQLDSIVDYGTELFDGKVGHNPIVSWVLRKTKPYKDIFAVRLVDYCYARRDEKETEFFNSKNRYIAHQDNFSKISGYPIAYWVSDNFFKAFESGKLLGEVGRASEGVKTGDNNRFLRFWFEVNAHKFSFADKRNDMKWYPHHKGGEYRKWYGNLEYVINWEHDGLEIKNSGKSGLQGKDMYFKPVLCWSKITSKGTSLRYIPENCLFDSGSPAYWIPNRIEYVLGFLNTLGTYMLDILNPTLNCQVGDIKGLPLIMGSDEVVEIISSIVNENILISQQDWDSFETSWDFKEHPFVKWSKKLWDCTAIGAAMSHYYGKHIEVSCPLELCFLLWQGECNERFNKLKANEEELNRIFIDIYGLQDELTPEVDDKDVTVRKADLQRDMRSFVSYAVGCMFGRYSLDREGLVFAGGDFDRVYWKHKGQAPLDENGEVPFGGGYAGVSIAPYNYPRFWNDTQDWENTPYLRFAPDADNCLPITEEHFFEDDIVTQFVDFVKAVFGEESLENNLRYVAENLGIKQGGTAREKIRQYFLKEFFKDHCKVYQKRPIYWLFDTGKKNGFKALCYVHRWNVNTVGNVRIDYMHKLQRLYRNEINRLKENIDAGEEIAKSQKRLEKITNQLHETEEYDAKIGIVVAARTEIDLDDGVKVNYDKVQTGSDGKHYQILAKI